MPSTYANGAAASAVREAFQADRIRELELLTGNTFIAPREPLAGDQLERDVDAALNALGLNDGPPDVAAALAGLYGCER
jgi:hypothetical protein